MNANIKYIQLCKDILAQGSLDSCCFLAYDAPYLYRDEEHSEVPEAILKLRDRISGFFLELYEILDIQEADIKTYLSALRTFRKEVLEIYFGITSVMSLYTIAFNKLSVHMCLEDEHIDNGSELTPDISKLMLLIMDYVGEAQDEAEKRARISKILSRIPLKMTKLKYEEYVEKSLLIHASSPEKVFDRTISYYKILLGAFHENNEGFFPEIRKLLFDVLGMDLKMLDKKKVEALTEELEGLRERMEDAEHFIKCIFDDIHNLMNMAYVAYDRETIFEEDYLVRDLFFALKDFFETENKQAFFDTLEERAEERILHYENVLYGLIEKSDKLESKVKVSDLNDDEFNWFIFSGQLKINSLVQIEEWRLLTDFEEFFENSGEHNTNEESIKLFIEFMNEKLEKLPVNNRKFVKQNFLAELFYPYDINDGYSDYISYLLEGIYDKSKMENVFISIAMLLQENGYTPWDEHSDSEEYMNDNHGHRHAHEHDCDCGHH